MPHTAPSPGDKQRASLSLSGYRVEIILEGPAGVSSLSKVVHSLHVPTIPSFPSSPSPNQGVCEGLDVSHRDTHFWETLH